MYEIHVSHDMSGVKGGGGRYCIKCLRCFCHRPSHLKFVCPAKGKLEETDGT